MGKVIFFFLAGLSFAGNLLFFYDPQCGYCEVQAQELLKNEKCLVKYKVYMIDVTEKPDYARAWGVKITPTLILQEKQYYVVEGVLTGRDLRRFLRCE